MNRMLIDTNIYSGALRGDQEIVQVLRGGGTHRSERHIPGRAFFRVQRGKQGGREQKGAWGV